MNVILSIKPKYARAILAGEKEVEFRKTKFAQKVEKVYIYSSSPDQKILGHFIIENIISDTPEKLWKKFKNVGSISKIDYFGYFENRDLAYAIKIKSYKKYKSPINPKEIFKKFTAPQSYIYCGDLSKN